MEVVIAAIGSAFVSSVIGAVVAAVVSKLQMVHKASEEAKQEAAELKTLMQQNILMTCRLAIYDSHFSVDEKLDAYKVYRSNGGNHQTKTYMDNLIGVDVDDYIDKHRKD